MALWQGESRRKPTGGRRIVARGKRRFEMGRDVQPTSLQATKRQLLRVRGGHYHARLLACNVANVTDQKTGKTQKTTIKTVVENPANPNYVRRNFITKGAIVETELGRARVTSRPGQDGVINAVLIQ